MKQLEAVLEVMSKRLGCIGTPVIAGGAVRDVLLGREPKDYDLFLLGRGPSREASEEVSARLSDMDHVKPLDWHKSEPFLVDTVRVGASEVQVMLTPETTMDALIQTFDWNICLFGYDGSVRAAEDISNIAPGKPLRLQRVTFPLSTLRRGFRFSERFQMIFLQPDIVALCAQVAAKAKAAASP